LDQVFCFFQVIFITFSVTIPRANTQVHTKLSSRQLFAIVKYLVKLMDSGQSVE